MCNVCQVVRLYNVVEIVVMYGEVACCSVVCGTLVGIILIYCVLAFCVIFVSCIVMMSGWLVCTSFLVPRFCF